MNELTPNWREKTVTVEVYVVVRDEVMLVVTIAVTEAVTEAVKEAAE